MKKLISIFLALTMCATLAVPAFAEETEELPALEENEILPTEEVLQLEETHECEDEAECVVSYWGGSDLLWEIEESEEGIEGVARWRMPGVDDGISVTGVNPNGTCTDCGKSNWQEVAQNPDPNDWVSENSSTHSAPYLVAHVCMTPGCTSGYYTRHTAREPHSLSRTDFGSSYHRGALHYIEWHCVCSVCGYTTTQWESRTCPGNNDGVGCIFPINGVKPPVEVQDVTEPEETVLPEETGILEEINMSTVMRLLADSKDDNAMNTRAADHDCNLLVRRVISTGYTVNGNQHQKYNLCEVYCMDECGVEGELKIPEGGWENHSFTTLVSGIPLNCCSGSSHQVGYEFQCVCGAKEIQKDSVSMKKTDFGSNYHRGALHYIEWIWRCPICGYTESRWESQSCPGNDNGEGCIFGVNKVEPPVEVQDVTEPEEVQSGEGTEPEEVTAPEETTAPEEAILPEESVLPEETAAPEEVTEPEEMAEPEETILPEETT